MNHDAAKLDLFLAYRAALVDYATRILGCPSRAEDVVQEAYLRFVPHSATAVEQPASYLYRIVRNLALDGARRLAVEVRWGAKEELPPSVLSTDPSPEDALIARSMMRALESALAELPDRTRLVFEMNRIGQYPVARIAETLGISQSLVYQLLRDAMTHCRGRVFGPETKRRSR